MNALAAFTPEEVTQISKNAATQAITQAKNALRGTSAAANQILTTLNNPAADPAQVAAALTAAGTTKDALTAIANALLAATN